MATKTKEKRTRQSRKRRFRKPSVPIRNEPTNQSTNQPINQSTNQPTNKQSHRRRITKITTSAVSYQVQGRRRCWPAHEDAHFKADRRRCNRHVDCIVNIDGQQPLKFSNNNNNNKITLAWRRNFKKKLKRKRKEKKKENATPSRKKSKVSGVGREIRNCC